MLHVIADSDTYLSILTSPAHVLAEVTVSVLEAVMVAPFFRWGWKRWHRKHDRDAHGGIS